MKRLLRRRRQLVLLWKRWNKRKAESVARGNQVYFKDHFPTELGMSSRTGSKIPRTYMPVSGNPPQWNHIWAGQEFEAGNRVARQDWVKNCLPPRAPVAPASSSVRDRCGTAPPETQWVLRPTWNSQSLWMFVGCPVWWTLCWLAHLLKCCIPLWRWTVFVDWSVKNSSYHIWKLSMILDRFWAQKWFRVVVFHRVFYLRVSQEAWDALGAEDPLSPAERLLWARCLMYVLGQFYSPFPFLPFVVCRHKAGIPEETFS